MKNTDMTISDVEKKLEALGMELRNVRGTTTEVYTRIVGYYRSVKNWNRGKREEYNYRTAYNVPEKLPETQAGPVETPTVIENESSMNVSRIASYQYFYRTTCPNCPPVKSYLSELGFSGNDINVDMDEGYNLAGNLAVCATPTVIFRNAKGEEIFRASNLQELVKSFEKEQAAV